MSQLESQTQCQKDYYPTRLAKETIIDRQHPVVYGKPTASSDVLSDEQLQSYEHHGYLIIPDVFNQEECSMMMDEFISMGESHQSTSHDEFIYEPDSTVLRSVFNPQQFSSTFDKLSREKRILEKVELLLGSHAYLMHSRINVKPAFKGKAFDWHSDFETWHAEDGIPIPRMVTGWVMLTDNTPCNGPLFVIPQSHHSFIGCMGETPEDNHKSSLRKQTVGVPGEEALSTCYQQGGIEAVTGRAGTIVFHESNLLHASPDNISPLSRTNAMFVYNSVENTPAKKPYAATSFRPEFLSSRNFSPLIKAEL